MSPRLLTAVLAFALLFPSFFTWLYFVALSGSRALGLAYAAGKLLQLALPLVVALAADRAWPRPTGPGGKGWVAGTVFAVLAAAAIAGATRGPLASAGVLDRVPGEVRSKLEPLGLGTPAGYLGVAVFYALVHSLLEEYYWRWFVFGRARRLIGDPLAVVVSALGFTAHHVILLHRFAPHPDLVAVAALGVFLGGAFWAWLYRRSGSLWAPWWSHLLVDAALMAVGYRLLWLA